MKMLELDPKRKIRILDIRTQCPKAIVCLNFALEAWDQDKMTYVKFYTVSGDGIPLLQRIRTVLSVVRTRMRREHIYLKHFMLKADVSTIIRMDQGRCDVVILHRREKELNIDWVSPLIELKSAHYADDESGGLDGSRSDEE